MLRMNDDQNDPGAVAEMYLAFYYERARDGADWAFVERVARAARSEFYSVRMLAAIWAEHAAYDARYVRGAS